MANNTQANWISNLPKYFVMALFGVAIFMFASKFFEGGETASVTVIRPASLSAVAGEGKTLFEANCVTCHGSNASGSDQGPPLVHDIYNPGHHADNAFYRAAKQGVRQHHWPFGKPNISGQHFIAVFRCPYDVVSMVEYAVRSEVVSGHPLLLKNETREAVRSHFSGGEDELFVSL